MSSGSLYRFQFRSGRVVLMTLTEDEAWGYFNAMLSDDTGAVITSKVKDMAMPFCNTDALEYVVKEGKVVLHASQKIQTQAL